MGRIEQEFIVTNRRKWDSNVSQKISAVFVEFREEPTTLVLPRRKICEEDIHMALSRKQVFCLRYSAFPESRMSANGTQHRRIEAIFFEKVVEYEE